MYVFVMRGFVWSNVYMFVCCCAALCINLVALRVKFGSDMKLQSVEELAYRLGKTGIKRQLTGVHCAVAVSKPIHGA